MDAVRTAIRLGAKKVSIVYRRRVADMTALPAEIEAAVAEGVELLTLVAPAGIEVDENGRVSGVRVDSSDDQYHQRRPCKCNCQR